MKSGSVHKLIYRCYICNEAGYGAGPCYRCKRTICYDCAYAVKGKWFCTYCSVHTYVVLVLWLTVFGLACATVYAVSQGWFRP